MLKFYKSLFFSTMIFSTLMAISSYSWFSIWISLEINLLSIIPLMTDSSNSFSSESALKYLITQIFASIILLFSIIALMKIQEYLLVLPLNMFNMMLNTSLLIKMGAAPFHFWVPEVAEGLNWNLNFLMLTWQKIAPIIILMYFLNSNFFLMIVIVVSSMVSGIMGLNQLSLRKIMAYSSINHLAWMLGSILSSYSTWLIYFLIYSITSLLIMKTFHYLNILYLSQLYNSLEKNKFLIILISLLFFSMAGIPPFLGFFPKWLIIMNLTYMNQFMTTFLMIIFTLIVLSFYLRLIIYPLMFAKNEMILYKTYKYYWMYWNKLIILLMFPINSLIFIN
uniref:NADH dehydrogenase subunit 2 n=1 Tax=Lema decempunctata TaxID=1412118 RepID=UPI0022A68C89|nr:NADH dehydrogenase subunit 2 [Lema decempunctata]UZS91157.1 NADH dehydrogenase subunit 2 [Lema decempunctata]